MNILDKLYDPSFTIPPWLWGALGLHDPEHDRRLGPWYDFLTHEALSIDGDIAEFGVYKGDSLITAAVLLRRAGSDKRMYGFDSFAGLPPLMKQDVWPLQVCGDVALYRAAVVAGLRREHRFADASYREVQARLERFNLKADLWIGEFRDNLRHVPNAHFAAVLLDCDLYQSYKDVLPFAWEHLADGGMIYLDEYYSLKYPGPRIATDEFCAAHGLKPQRILGHSRPGEFERWCLRK